MRFTLFALLLAPCAFPQAMIENALAASGGSAAGVAGKPVSDATTAILGKASSLLEKAAGPRVKRDEAPQQQATRPAAVTIYAIMPPSPPLPEILPETFQQVKVGQKREELLAKLGPPSSKIMIPEDSQMVELYRYRANGTALGSVRIVDGTVTEVLK